MARAKISNLITSAGWGLMVFAFAFATAILSSSQFAPVSDGAATTGVSAQVTSQAYYANITSAGTLNIDVTATPEGARAMGVDALTVNTNAANGYKLYISTSSANTGLYKGGDTSVSPYIAQSAGSLTTPVQLAVNTWGYATNKDNASAGSDTGGTAGTPGATITKDSAYYVGVPAEGSSNLLYTNSAPTTGVDQQVLSVYYGVNANTGLSSGSYTNTVQYTAIAEGTAEGPGASVAPDRQFGLAAGQTITVATNLYPGFDESVLAQELGNITVAIGGSPCTNPTPSLNSTSGSLNITCTTPTNLSYGVYDVVVYVSKYDKTYTITDAYSYIQKFFDPTLTMQDFYDLNTSHGICGYGDGILPYPSATAANYLTIDNWKAVYASGTPSTSAAGGYVPQALLTDERDGNVYLVRKLADQKCWMIDNLQLAPGTVLNDKTTSDIDGTVVTSATVGADNSALNVSDGASWQAAWNATISGQQQNANLAVSTFTSTVNSQTTDNHNYTVQTIGDKTESNANKVGVLYSWKAATAGTGNGSTTSGGAANDPFGTNMNTAGNNTRVSVCPAGWRLPTGGPLSSTSSAGQTAYIASGTAPSQNGDFAYLDKSYGGTGENRTDTSDPGWQRLGGNTNNHGYQMVWSGRIYSDGYQGLNASGYSWSTTVNSYQYSYLLLMSTSGYMYPQYYDHKLLGFPVRCVAR